MPNGKIWNKNVPDTSGNPSGKRSGTNCQKNMGIRAKLKGGDRVCGRLEKKLIIKILQIKIIKWK